MPETNHPVRQFEAYMKTIEDERTEADVWLRNVKPDSVRGYLFSMIHIQEELDRKGVLYSLMLTARLGNTSIGLRFRYV